MTKLHWKKSPININKLPTSWTNHYFNIYSTIYLSIYLSILQYCTYFTTLTTAEHRFNCEVPGRGQAKGAALDCSPEPLDPTRRAPVVLGEFLGALGDQCGKSIGFIDVHWWSLMLCCVFTYVTIVQWIKWSCQILCESQFHTHAKDASDSCFRSWAFTQSIGGYERYQNPNDLSQKWNPAIWITEASSILGTGRYEESPEPDNNKGARCTSRMNTLQPPPIPHWANITVGSAQPKPTFILERATKAKHPGPVRIPSHKLSAQ